MPSKRISAVRIYFTLKMPSKRISAVNIGDKFFGWELIEYVECGKASNNDR